MGTMPSPGDELREEAEVLRRVASDLRRARQLSAAQELEEIAEKKESESYRLDRGDDS